MSVITGKWLYYIQCHTKGYSRKLQELTPEGMTQQERGTGISHFGTLKPDWILTTLGRMFNEGRSCYSSVREKCVITIYYPLSSILPQLWGQGAHVACARVSSRVPCSSSILELYILLGWSGSVFEESLKMLVLVSDSSAAAAEILWKDLWGDLKRQKETIFPPDI